MNSKLKYVKIVALIGIFTFVFLYAEYLYVGMVSLTTSGEKAVTAQNYALGVSAVGFGISSFICGKCENVDRYIWEIIAAIVSIPCIFIVCVHVNYAVTFISGMTLFLMLGIIGSSVFYKAVLMVDNNMYLGRVVGFSYTIGIMLQFLNNNIIKSLYIEAAVLSVFLIIIVVIMIKSQTVFSYSKNMNSNYKKSRLTGGLLIILVVFMTCIFSTLDNAVTLVHVDGVMDIGQWPRILLALSGCIAGIVFDIMNRNAMSYIMYCVMILSTICIAVIRFSQPFVIGLVIFYMSAGFFAVFFTTAFMEISQYMKMPRLWAGLGRAVNNLTAALITGGSLALLSSDNNILFIIVVLVIFVIVSTLTILYSSNRNALMNDESEPDNMDNEEKIDNIAVMYSFTQREKEVFDFLVNTDDNIQTIADNMFVSRRTLERYISAIYKKTGVKSRVSLINIFNNK